MSHASALRGTGDATKNAVRPMLDGAPCGPRYHEQIAAARVAAIRRALDHHGGSRTEAARCLGLQRTYLLRLMRANGLQDLRGLGGAMGHKTRRSVGHRP